MEPEKVDCVEFNPSKYRNERFLLRWDISKYYNRIFYTSHQDDSDLKTWIEAHKNCKVRFFSLFLTLSHFTQDKSQFSIMLSISRYELFNNRNYSDTKYKERYKIVE